MNLDVTRFLSLVLQRIDGNSLVFFLEIAGSALQAELSLAIVFVVYLSGTAVCIPGFVHSSVPLD